MQFLFGLWLISQSYAENTAEQAEYERLSIELEKMTTKAIWNGADKRFVELEEIGLPVQFEHFVMGAQAAQELGDMLECKKRLAEALEIKPKKKQIRQWYNQIDEEYGYVALFSTSRGEAKLERVDYISSPIHSKALSFATQSLDKKGEFEGLLPIGQYNFSGQEFQLRAGIAVHLELSPRMRRLELRKKNNKEE